MYLSPLRPFLGNSQYYASGDVNIAEGAAIATGVILQADPDCHIVIAAGVCIGMGAVLHAHQGSIEVETGATLGAGVLVVGNVKIGANACIGTGSTILNCSLEKAQVLSAGSLWGDHGREIRESLSPTTGDESPIITEDESIKVDHPLTTDPLPPQVPPIPEDVTADRSTPASTPGSAGQIYAYKHLSQLRVTLFPHHQPQQPTDLNGQSPHI